MSDLSVLPDRVCLAQGEGPAASAALLGLLEDFDPLVVSLATRLAVEGDRDDAVQEGRLALMMAIFNFDPNAGRDFATYAKVYVDGAIRRQFMKTIKIRSHEDPRGLIQSDDDGEEEGGDAPSSLAVALAGQSLPDVVETLLIQIDVRAWLATLSIRDQWMLSRLYWDNATSSEVAVQIGMTRRGLDKARSRVLSLGAIALAHHRR